MYSLLHVLYVHIIILLYVWEQACITNYIIPNKEYIYMYMGRETTTHIHVHTPCTQVRLRQAGYGRDSLTLIHTRTHACTFLDS